MMTELWAAYWPIIMIALIAGAVAGYLIFRPRQRVTLSKDTPVRPHMTQSTKPILHDGGVTTDQAPQTHDHLPGASGPPDDLRVLKGVGPKLAVMLGERGLTRFDQLASLSSGQVETLDADLGPFRGRFMRDRIVEQAHYLARGDLDGYRKRFGAL